MALSPPSPWLRTWAILWPAGDQPLSLIQNYSKYFKICLNMSQQSSKTILFLHPFMPIGRRVIGIDQRWQVCWQRQLLPDKTRCTSKDKHSKHVHTAYSCIFVLSLRRCLAVFGHVLSSVWWILVDFAPSFHVLYNSSWPQLTQATSPSVLRFWLSYEDFRPVIRVGLSQINLDPAHWSPIWEIFMFSSIVYSNIF